MHPTPARVAARRYSTDFSSSPIRHAAWTARTLDGHRVLSDDGYDIGKIVYVVRRQTRLKRAT
ncbi:hypothetical protein [Paraburkholderia megapolitana]|uniref:hypothetical protein n=1 Tax=Paraburkholderia megapolitana TaxID=420953 RepID=UPI0038B99494